MKSAVGSPENMARIDSKLGESASNSGAFRRKAGLFAMMPEENRNSKNGKIMLVGSDHKQILERRFQAAGCRVVKVHDNEAAFDHVRREAFDKTVLVSRGSLINVTETVFNLRDLNDSMEIIIVVERLGKQTSRFLRQLLEHPIEGTQIVTRRQLQRQLHAPTLEAPPGGAG